MILWSMHSDRTGERQLHSALPLLIAALALAASGFTRSALLSIALIGIALAGLYAFKSPFWSLPSLFLTRSTAAISIASINSIGNLGGFAGPYMIGLMKGWTGSQKGGLLFLSALLLLACALTYFIRLATPKGIEPGGDRAGSQ
jgi:ACS family tartrate transporter-like MFS transporter